MFPDAPRLLLPPVRPGLAAVLCTLLAGGCGYISDKELAARMDLDGDGVPRPEDCDDNDPDVGVLRWYPDTDRDGFGDPEADMEESCVQRAGMVSTADDCDDSDASVNPDAEEICNFVDDDCNGAADDNAVDPSLWYYDGDDDGLGDRALTTRACAAPEGFVPLGGDCDDSDPSITEGRLWYADGDGDGWGDPVTTVVSCEGPPGHTRRAGDCDDGDPTIHPNAFELCDDDNRDEDCDGAADDADSSVVEASQSVFYEDADGDGYGSATATRRLCDPVDGVVENRDDCDDLDPSITTDQCPWIAVDAGSVATCGIRGDHRVQCWGEDSIADAVPEGIFREVAVGLTHACAVGVDDEVQCWGALECDAAGTSESLETLETQVANTCGLTSQGALICWNGGVEYRLARTDQDFTAVVSGTSHTCGLLEDGSVTCLGNCYSGECAEQAGPYAELAAGWRVSCALTETGEAECWGIVGSLAAPPGPLSHLDGYGELFCALSLNGDASCWTRDGQSFTVPGVGFVDIAVGAAHACGLDLDGTITCVGDDSYGQLQVPGG
jgi:hypothetical protein